MKKLLSVVLAVMMLFSAAIIPAQANGVDVEVDVSDQFIPELINGFYFDCGDTDNYHAVLTGVGDDNKVLAELTIPVSVTYGGEEFTIRAIAEDAFAECVNLITINYAGNKVEWREIDIQADLTNVTINYTLLPNDNDILAQLESRTETSITLRAVPGCEYKRSISGAEWQDSPVFENLTPGTPHAFKQRYKETDTHQAGPTSPDCIFVTLKSTPAAPAAPTLMNKTTTTVTLVPIAYEFSMDGVNWQNGNEFTGLTPGTTYKFYQRIPENATSNPSPASEPLIVTTYKEDQSAPATPTLSSKTTTTVTLKAVTGYEYSKNGTTWQSSNKFTGLSVATTYKFYQRKKATSTKNASPKSAALSVTTNKASQTAPAKPTLSSKTTTTVTLKAVSGCEYSKDGKTWQSSTKFTGLKAYTTYKFYQRKKATSTKNASPASAYYSVKTNCSHKYKTTATTKATFTKNGKTTTKCTVCGNVSKTATVRYAKTVKLSTTSYTYSGGVKKPSVVVKNSAGTTISTSHYTVTYASGRKNVGKYKVTVKMKGYYTGTKTLYFTINPVKTTVSKLTAGKKSIKVTVGKKTSQVTGYQIQYSTSSKFTSPKTKNITSYKTTSTTLTKLTSKKTYYVRVRTYKTVSGKKYYSGWSTYKSAKAK